MNLPSPNASSSTVLSKRLFLNHRCRQRCVDTRVRLGYATFDAQLRNGYFVTTLYASVRA